MRVLVTGGAGYLGSILVPELLALGHEVTVYDIFKWGVHPMLPVARHPKLTLIKGDVRDNQRYGEVVNKADVIVNLAAIVGFPACAETPLDARTTNLDSVRALADLASRNQLIIQASTGSTYGKVDDVCTEDTPINPVSLYGETKAEAEKPVLENDGIALRFATVFGISPRIRLDLLVNDIVYQVVHYRNFVMFEGHARRTFLHSTDAARSIIFAIENRKEMAGKAFNVGDETMNYTKRQIAEIVRDKHDYYLHSAEFGEDKDKRDYEVSYDRIKKLGFCATISMSEGIDELLNVMPLLKETSPMRNI